MFMWLSLNEAMAFVARHANQQRSELLAMPLPTFAVWLRAVTIMAVREIGGSNG